MGRQKDKNTSKKHPTSKSNVSTPTAEEVSYSQSAKRQKKDKKTKIQAKSIQLPNQLRRRQWQRSSLSDNLQKDKKKTKRQKYKQKASSFQINCVDANRRGGLLFTICKKTKKKTKRQKAKKTKIQAKSIQLPNQMCRRQWRRRSLTHNLQKDKKKTKRQKYKQKASNFQINCVDANGRGVLFLTICKKTKKRQKDKNTSKKHPASKSTVSTPTEEEVSYSQSAKRQKKDKKTKSQKD